MIHFVTGATGLLGSHIAEQLRQRGHTVRALVRPTGDTRFLQSIGVELCSGDLADPASIEQAASGAAVVYHAAAKVGDWGRWEDFERDVIDATRNVTEACSRTGIERLVYVSSTSAYGHPREGAGPITEDYPLGANLWIWDYYVRAKVEAEREVWERYRRTGLPVTVIRPGWIYGPRDRTSIFRLARSLRLGLVGILGDGSNRINSVYAGNVAEACILAAEKPEAVGQAYNITNDGVITQRRYFNLFADALGLPRPWVHIPYQLAFMGAFLVEGAFRLAHSPWPPFMTRYVTWLIGRSTFYSTDKARTHLGWRPRVGYEEGIQRTAAWYKSLL